VARLTGLTGLAWLTAGAGRAAGTARAAGAGGPACSWAAAVTAMTARSTLAAVAAVAARSTLATAAVTAGGIEEGRTADGVHRGVRQVSAGDGCGEQRARRRGQKYAGSRAEYGHTTAICRHVSYPHNLSS
jgi:hypothetical protein